MPTPAHDHTLAGLNVLIVGINYWPEPTGIAPYTTGMAEHLASEGALVRVITGIPHYPQWRVPERYRGRLIAHEHRRGVHVTRLWHSVPRQMTGARRAAYEATFMTHAALRALRRRPDLVIAATPALGGAVAGAAVARRARCPMIVVVQDLMAQAAGQSGIPGGGRLTRITARIEGAALRAATMVAVVSDSFRPIVEAYGVQPDRIALLRNWTHVATTSMGRNEARAQLGWPSDRFIAVHTGAMGFKQDLGNVIEAARHLQGTRVEVILVGDGSRRGELQTQAAGIDNIRFVDPVDPDIYPAVLAAADVLLVNERATVVDMSLPSKITSYLAAGQPVVAAVMDGGATHCELTATGGAARIVAPGNPSVLGDAIADLVGKKAELDAMGRAAATYAADHLGSDAALRTLSTLMTGASARHRGTAP